MKKLFIRRALAAGVTAGLISVPLWPAYALEPAVQGPESVRDWWNAGQQFVQGSQELKKNNRRVKNVILFIGDGMGVSTVTAARILEGQMKGNPGEENLLSFERLPNVALSKVYHGTSRPRTRHPP